MDPITILVTAVVLGAAAGAKDVAAQAVKDAYAGLKSLIVRKFGGKADVEEAVKGVEKKPESDARKAVLKEELETAEAGQDAEVVKEAKALLRLLEKHNELPATYQAAVYGSGAIAKGEEAVAAGERGVATSGDVRGWIVTGDNNEIKRK
ncbi:MAG: hypothetical protein ACOC6F_02880 [bacterium]